MKKFLTNALTVVLFLPVLAGSIWLGLHSEILFLLGIAVMALVLVLWVLVALFAPPSSSAPPRSLSALLLGLVIGWWFGGGFGDGDC